MSVRKKSISYILLLLWIFKSSRGSSVRVQGEPPTVKDGLTRDVTLTCDLQDTAPSSTLIGRRNLIPAYEFITENSRQLSLLAAAQTPHGKDSILVKRSTSLLVDTPYNVDELLSIIVTQDSTEIASVTHKQNPVVLDSSIANLQVSGQIVNAVSGQGNLTLSWKNPSASQLEGLECHVVAMDQLGHTVNFAQSFEFNILEPSIMDIVKQVAKLENDRDTADAKIKQLENENKELRANVTYLSHIETGRICENSEQQHSSSSGFGNRDVTKSVSFQTAYDSPPKVVLGYSVLHMSTGKDDVIRYSATAMNVDEKGFSVQFHTWNWNVMYGGCVDWISVPA